jgi:hypothetical protein
MGSPTDRLPHGEPSRERQAPSGRRQYKRPELTSYGPLAKLTQGSKSGTGENTPGGVKRKTCL